MSPRTGRPPKGNDARNINLNIRVTKKESEDIQECADRLNVTRTDALMKGIELVKSELDKK